MPRRALVWLRRDLRLCDHRPLAAAIHDADEIVLVFVFDTRILSELKDRDDKRVTFILESLRYVDEELRARGSQLLVRVGDPVEAIPAVAKRLACEVVFAGRDYEPYAKERDLKVSGALAEFGSSLCLVKDQVVFEGLEVSNGDGEPYKVFSPYHRAWTKKLEKSATQESRVEFKALVPRSQIEALSAQLDYAEIGFEHSESWARAGYRSAVACLDDFSKKISDYATDRDFPAIEGTSRISVHLRFGTISTRECVRRALEGDSLGHERWLAELVWREFYQMILDQFPHVSSRPFQPAYDSVDWPGSQVEYERWEAGETGYPIVDAAMRCLNQTGWMHNRLRMVAASFLTKHLLCTYQWGEAHFARKLLDFDLAQNNGGWQWAASTGVDPQPYFRVFNPTLQSMKFDPDGIFIRQWVPELAEFDSKQIHFPSEASEFEQISAGCEIGMDYPAPMVDHAASRDRAVAFLESIKRQSGAR